jgi:esterase
MQLHFESFGEGEPLIILHGLLGSGDNWLSIGRGLADTFRIYLVDARNHGRSPHCAEMGYPEMAADLVEFLEQQELSKVNLLGHSMGGKTAMHFALSHPQKVARLVVADMALRRYPPHHREILDALISLEPDSFQSRTEIEQALEPKIPKLAIRRFLLKSLKRNSEGNFYWQLDLAAINQNYARLSEALESEKPFEHPTLFVRGGLSDYISDSDIAQIYKLFPGAEIQSLPEAGHWLHAEQPTEFLRIVREFLLRNDATRPA